MPSEDESNDNSINDAVNRLDNIQIGDPAEMIKDIYKRLKNHTKRIRRLENK